MLNIEKYKDEIIKKYQNLLITNDIDTDGNKMNKAIKIVASEKCNKCLKGAKEPFMWLLEEYTEPILDDEEKAYLKLVIKNCRDNVRYISKKLDDYWSEEYICISIDGTSEAVSPRFIENTQFKKMVCDRKYTLEELGL